VVQEKVNTYKYQRFCIILRGEDIISRYGKAFKALTKRSPDTPRYVCVSCEKLCLKKMYLKLINLKHKWIHFQFGKI